LGGEDDVIGARHGCDHAEPVQAEAAAERQRQTLRRRGGDADDEAPGRGQSAGRRPDGVLCGGKVGDVGDDREAEGLGVGFRLGFEAGGGEAAAVEQRAEQVESGSADDQRIGGCKWTGLTQEGFVPGRRLEDVAFPGPGMGQSFGYHLDLSTGCI
jgi:hypothetical protein